MSVRMRGPVAANVALFLLILLGYQNCSDVKFKTGGSSSAPPPPKTFDAISLPDQVAVEGQAFRLQAAIGRFSEDSRFLWSRAGAFVRETTEPALDLGVVELSDQDLYSVQHYIGPAFQSEDSGFLTVEEAPSAQSCKPVDLQLTHFFGFPNRNMRREYTFNNVAIGAPAADRVLILGVVHTGNNQSLFDRVTIDGVNAVEVRQSAAGGNQNTTGGLYYLEASKLPNPDATAVTVVTRTSGGERDGAAIMLYRMTGGVAAAKASSVQPYDREAISARIDLAKGGVAIGWLTSNANNVGASAWVGLTKDGDGRHFNENNRVAVARMIATQAMPGHQVQATYAPTGQGVLLLGSWESSSCP